MSSENEADDAAYKEVPLKVWAYNTSSKKASNIMYAVSRTLFETFLYDLRAFQPVDISRMFRLSVVLHALKTSIKTVLSS